MKNSPLETYYSKKYLELASTNFFPSHILGEIIGYRKVKVPTYLTIKVPMVEKHYDSDYDYEDDEFRGWLISFKEVKLFKIGHKIEEVPIYKKRKPGSVTIKFKRYSKLNPKLKHLDGTAKRS